MFEIYKDYIDKMDRRVAKIEANPDPTKLFSTKFRYQMERDEMLEKIQAYEQGIPIGYSVCGLGARIFPAMGAYYLHPSITADSVLAGHASRLMDRARELGYPDRACERTLLPIAAVADSQMPPPSFCVATTDSCDWMAQECIALARLTGCPIYTIDTPPEHSESALLYLTNQLRDMLKFLEKEVPALKPFDEEALRERQDYHARLFGYLRDVYTSMMNVPAPLPNREAFRLTYLDRLPENRELCETHFRLLRDEVAERVEKGVEGVPGERLRIMLAVSGPFYSDLLNWLERRGVAMVILYNGIVPSYAGVAPSMFDEQVFGRKLSPLEKEARRQQDITWGGFSEEWASGCVELCKAFKVDSILYMLQSGCTPTLGNFRLLAEKAEKELDVRTLAFEGRMMINDTYDEQKLHDVIENFIEVEIARKERG